MKLASYICAFMFALTAASAQTKRASGGDYHSSSGQHAVSAALGIYSPGAALYTAKINGNDASERPGVSGLFGIGGDYEYIVAPDLTVGGFFRYYSSSDSTTQNNEQKVSAWTLAGQVRAYLPTEHWLPYLGAGLGMVSASLKNSSNGNSQDYDPSATIGLNMAMGLLYKVDERVAFGVENLRVWALGEKTNGMPINDFMFKGRFVF